MKKFLSVVLAVLLVLACAPLTFAAFAVDEEIAGPQNTDNMPISVIYRNAEDGKLYYLGHWSDANKNADGTHDDALDAAMDAMKALYEGPLADASLTDTNGNGLSDELYEAAGSPVIKLNSNYKAKYERPNWCSESGRLYNINKIVTFVIDGDDGNGGRYTLSYGSESEAYSKTYAFSMINYYNTELKNLNIKVYNDPASPQDGLFRAEPVAGIVADNSNTRSYFTMNNVTLTENYEFTGVANSNVGGIFKLMARGVNDKYNTNFDTTVDINLINTTVNTKSALGLYAQGINRRMTANVSMVNSSWTQSGKYSQTNGNDACFAAQGYGTLNLTMDGTSSLISARTRGTTSSIVRATAATSVFSATLAKGATLALFDTGLSGASAFLPHSLSATVNVTDNGATYKAGAACIANGVALPDMFKDASGNDHLWMANGTKVSSPYTATVSGEVVFTHTATDDPATNPSNIATATVGGELKYYGNVITAANAADANTEVNIIRPCDIAGGDITNAATINCNGFAVTISGQISAKVNGKVEFKNGEITLNKDLRAEQGYSATVAFTDITMSLNGNLRIDGSGSKYLFKDSTITGVDNNAMFFCAAKNPNNAATPTATGTIELDNSIITQINGDDKAHHGNNGVIHMVTKASYGAKNAEYTIILKNHSALKNECNNDDSEYAAVIVAEEEGKGYNNKVTVNVDSTSSLVNNSTSNALTGASVLNHVQSTNNGALSGDQLSDGKTDWVLNIEGDINVSANVAPDFNVENLGNYVWVKDGSAVKYGVYGGDANVTFNLVKVDLTLAGASIRATKDSGIRFSTTTSEAVKGIANVKFGTLVGATSLLDGAALTTDLVTGNVDTDKAIRIDSTKFDATNLTYHGVILLSDGAQYYQFNVTGRGFVEITCVDGTVLTFYTEAKTTNMYEIAKAIGADNSLAAAEIIAAVDAVKA